MIHIIDDIFPKHLLEHFGTTINRSMEPFVSGYASKEGEGYFEWEEQHPHKAMCRTILDRASHYENIPSDVDGYEYWTHINTRPNDTHQDKDEVAYLKHGISRFPLFSTVFYLEIKDLYGGELVFEDGVEVIPKANRLVVFKKGLEHRVRSFSGHRVSIAVNPWSTKLYK
tara:strand:+ start:955 stop:1464 length:510 start_codon:yes stop_codon:yes gene_type:complete